MQTNTVKHGLLLMGLTIFVVIFFEQTAHLLGQLHKTYVMFDKQLGAVFSNGYWGVLIRKTTSSILLPLFIVGIPAGIYYAFKKRMAPHFYPVLWGLWLVLMANTLMH